MSGSMEIGGAALIPNGPETRTTKEKKEKNTKKLGKFVKPSPSSPHPTRVVRYLRIGSHLFTRINGSDDEGPDDFP